MKEIRKHPWLLRILDKHITEGQSVSNAKVKVKESASYESENDDFVDDDKDEIERLIKIVTRRANRQRVSTSYIPIYTLNHRFLDL